MGKEVTLGRMKSMNKVTLAQASLATFEDNRKGINVSGTREEGGGKKRKRRHQTC